MAPIPSLHSLPVQPITAAAFQPYGQLITPMPDAHPYGPDNAQLVLSPGIPRFYLMHLTHRGRRFHQMTRHVACTQCLGSLAGKSWLLAVAPPSGPDHPDRPDRAALQAFQIPGNCFVKLAIGTWHAGPYFDHPFVDFYNLELSDTNEVDHFSYDFQQVENIIFELVGGVPDTEIPHDHQGQAVTIEPRHY